MEESMKMRVILVLLVLSVLPSLPAYADTNHPPVIQNPKKTKPWHVDDMKMEGFPRCGAGTWMFDFSWKPILHNGAPYAKYKVAGYGCTQSKYQCTSERCQAQIWGCTVRLSGTWAAVTADFTNNGVRIGTFLKPPSCK
jgi:hypothetical protein